MIRKSDLINTINNYKNRLPLVAFPMHFGINLKDNLKYIDFLSSLLLRSNGDEIKLNDYADLQMYMQAVNILNNVSELPNYGKDDDSRKAVKSWYKKKFHIPGSDPISILFVDEIFELVNKWHEQERYIKIPDEFEAEAYESVMPYLQKYNSLSREKQIEIEKKMQMLEKLKSPKTLFEKAKIMADNGLVAMINKIQSEHANKEELIGHVFVDLFHDFPKGDFYMAKSILSINNWLMSGIDDKYRITKKTIKKMLSSAPKKNSKESDDKLKNPEDEKATAELKALGKRTEQIQDDDPQAKEKAKLKKAFDDEFRRIGIEFDGAEQQTALSQNLFENLTPETLAVEPSIADYNNFLKVNERAMNSEQAVRDRIDNVLTRLSSQNNT